MPAIAVCALSHYLGPLTTNYFGQPLSERFLEKDPDSLFKTWKINLIQEWIKVVLAY